MYDHEPDITGRRFLLQKTGRLLLIATLLWAVPLFAQQNDEYDDEEGNTPVGVLKQFKSGIDKADYRIICSVMAEEDGSGPLQRIHYEQMQRSLEGIVNMWRGKPFQYGVPEIKIQKGITVATVPVKILNLSQEVKFVLLRFDRRWYVFDIEIFFK